MKTCISYASYIRVTAGKVKKYLDTFGFNCFVAHEDIPPQTEWPTQIMNALKESDLFLPLLTPGFISSFYCQQETGFAYCNEIEILPVYISKAPMGMIANIQAVRFKRKLIENSCWKIINHIGKRSNNKKQILDALIKWFGESNQYIISTERAANVLNQFAFSPRQIKRIKKYIKEEGQIYQNKEARNYIFKFMDKHSDYFDKDFRDWYDSSRASRMHMRY